MSSGSSPENVDGAKQFLADYIQNCREAFLTSGFQNTPAFPGAVPDLATLVTNDGGPGAPKCDLLADLATLDDQRRSPRLYQSGDQRDLQQGVRRRCSPAPRPAELTPEQALDQADREVRAIFQSWKERGKV